jgi:hypothetical protein
MLKKKLFPFNYIKEYKINNLNDYFIGKKINNNIFFNGEKVNISSITIGKGFSGNIKVHNFKRGPETHGSKHHRLQGSLGAGTNWMDAGIRQGFMTDHQLSISGGSAKNKYYISGNYFKNDGMMLSTYFERMSIRVNTDNQITDKIIWDYKITEYEHNN